MRPTCISLRVLFAALALFLLASCEDAAPAAKPDVVQPDIAADADPKDVLAGSDSTADSLTGGTDAEVGSDIAQTCASPCVDNDDNPCTYQVCEAGACVQKTLADGSVCEDGDPCTTADTCQTGTCKASTAPGSNACGCQTSADCAAFDDGLQCNGQLYCDKAVFPYVCKVNPATVPPCESQTPPSTCLTAACLEPAAAGGKAQCSWKPLTDGSACDDKNPLTEGDVCAQGVCVAGQFIGSCQTTADCGQYEDNNLCNGQLFCNKAKGQCQLNPASVVVCPTGEDTTCRKNSCQPTTGKCALAPIGDGEVCDDGNGCTTGEVCLSGACTGATNTCSCTADADCAAQEDGNLCNGTLYCNLEAGKCQLNPASVVACGESANPCQTLTCEPASGQCLPVANLDGTPCNADNTLCTLADACQAGQCQAGENLCKCGKTADCALFEDGDQCNGQLFCNLQKGACEHNPASVVTCDSGLDTPCAKQVCVPLAGECTAIAQNEGGGCDDGNACSLGDTCQAGTCLAGVAACACATDADCLQDEDGNLCNGTLYCDGQSGTCKVNPATIVSCADGLPGDCTATACEPSSGKCYQVQASVGAPCDDGDSCTAGEICGQAGQCAGGFGVCGCQNDGDCSVFDDGNACNGQVVCDLGVLPSPQCKLTPPVVCPAGLCQVASCNPDSGACSLGSAPTGTACDDANPCTLLESCADAGCVGTAKDCDDGNACTADICAGGSCLHQPVADNLPCDAVPCSVADTCLAGTCNHTWADCDDLNPCTLDTCSVEQGTCSHSNSSEPCDDADACTEQDLCVSGKCMGQPTACTDGAACEVVTCDSEVGCVTQGAEPGVACDDGNLCTLTDRCAAGAVCVGSDLKICDDGDPCTTDPGCSQALVDEAGCAAGLADGNPMVYWQSTGPADGLSLISFAYNPTSGAWGAVGYPIQGADATVRLWQGANATGTDHPVDYPGNNLPQVLAPDTGTGWLVGGKTGTASQWLEQGSQPFLANLNQDGEVQWVSSTLTTNAVISDIERKADADPTASTTVVVAGTQNAHANELAGRIWLAEVELTATGPKLLRSGLCESGNTSMGLYGSHVVRLTSGDWIVAGYGKYDNGEWTEELPVWCRFSSDFKLIQGPNYDLQADSQQEMRITDLHARPEGGFWAIAKGQNLSSWRAYTDKGLRTFAGELPSAVRRGLPIGNSMYMVQTDDSGIGIALSALGVAIQGDSTLLTYLGSEFVGMTEDKHGVALLYVDWNLGTYTLQHMDPDLSTSCSAAQTCPNNCEDGDPCSIDFCKSAVCANEAITCDDEDVCTADSCGAKGCTFVGISDVDCDDGSNCTLDDQCMSGQCLGTSRFGASSAYAALEEQIVDGVVHGDGLLVLGNTLVDAEPVVFWRKYGPDRSVVASGTIAAGSAVTLARAKVALLGQGVFEQVHSVAALLVSPEGHEQVWYINPSAQTVQAVPGNLSINQLTIQRGRLVQDTETAHAFAIRTMGVSTGDVVRVGPQLGAQVMATTAEPGFAPVGLQPLGSDWLLVTSGTANGFEVSFVLYDSDFVPKYPAYFQALGQVSGPETCQMALASQDGAMVHCGSDTALHIAEEVGVGLTVSAMTNLLVTPATTGMENVSLGNERSVALRQDGNDGEWALVWHDGVYNQSNSTLLQATTVPVLAVSDLDVWLVSETVVGNAREVAVRHWDRYANASCADSGSCYQNVCNDGQFCTVDQCSNSFCFYGTISPHGNCGTTGTCGQGQCGTGEF